MKKIIAIILFLAVICIACQENNLDIEILGHPKNQSEDIRGEWTGILTCQACCNPTYQLTLTIEDNKSHLVEGEFISFLTIKSIKNDKLRAYATYQVPTQFENGVLKLNGGNIIEEKRYTYDGCQFCKKNFFTLKRISPNRFEGTWDSSSSCDRTFQENATVVIERNN